jgi:hypothetical protein
MVRLLPNILISIVLTVMLIFRVKNITVQRYHVDLFLVCQPFQEF